MYYVCLFIIFTEATMGYLSRKYFYLSLSAMLLLSILLSANAEADPKAISYDDFEKASNVCRSRRHTHTVRVHSNCKVDVTSRKCAGYCRSYTDFALSPPYRSNHCSCCKANKQAITYKVELHNCWQYDERRNKVYTNEKVKISVPYDLTCECLRCNRIAGWFRLELLQLATTIPDLQYS